MKKMLTLIGGLVVLKLFLKWYGELVMDLTLSYTEILVEKCDPEVATKLEDAFDDTYGKINGYDILDDLSSNREIEHHHISAKVISCINSVARKNHWFPED